MGAGRGRDRGRARGADRYAMGQRDGVFLGVGRSAVAGPRGRGLESTKAGGRRDGRVGQPCVWNTESDELILLFIPVFSSPLPPPFSFPFFPSRPFFSYMGN